MEKHKRQNQRAGLYQDQKKDNILSIRHICKKSLYTNTVDNVSVVY